MSGTLYYKIITTYFILWGIIFIIVARLVLKDKPKEMKRYPIKTILMYLLPFYNGWQQLVSEEDLTVMQRYKKKVIAWQLFILVSFIMFYLVLFLPFSFI